MEFEGGSDRVEFYTVIGVRLPTLHRAWGIALSRLFPSMPFFIKRKHESRITGNVYAVPEVVNNVARFSRILG